ncbi:sodium:calcium antiporter [Planococcus lenghuensis]|uniref:Cation transporter n=1 Tax=Planococcus lenghuensis TaxID=2213202 RepID=A0A1Q2KWN8_9BACL|nr:sodium:calcium antiporter [Planococcus lenghuensis]AQQ52563.1 cation transporter [Planococcus lenghuensis]
MVFVYFILAAAVTVFAAIKLSSYADVISEKSALGGMMVGTLLLAGATSLPEVTTSISAGIIGNADIAVGNVFGSNLFNLFILAVFDIAYRRRKLLEQASYAHTYTALLGLFLTVLALTALYLEIDASIFGVGIDTIIILLFYAIGMAVISRLPSPPLEPAEPASAPDSPVRAQSMLSIRQAGIRFALAALLIMAAGTALSVLGDRIAVVTGLGSSFVGSFLIAATTSLPEAVSVFIALRLNNANLAVGSILGSNIFNMVILAVADLSYRDGAVLSAASGAHVIIASGVIAMALLVLYMLRRGKTGSLATYTAPAILILLVYFTASYLNFIY